MPNLIACQSCNTEYDGRFAEPGAKFRCTTCGAVVAVSINHNPNAVGHPATGGVELIRGGASTFGSPVGSTIGPAPHNAPGYAPQPAPLAPPAINAPAPASTWVPNTSVPTVRGYGIPILLMICTFGIYTYYWWYKTHAEHPRRKGIDPTGGQVLFWMLAPNLVSGALVSVAQFATYGVRQHQRLSEVWNEIVHPPTDHLVHPLGLAGLVAMGVGVAWQFRIVSKISERMNLLCSTLPAGPTAPRVNKGLGVAFVGLNTLVGSAMFFAPLAAVAAMVLPLGLMITWWVQVQRASDSLARNALTGRSPGTGFGNV